MGGRDGPWYSHQGVKAEWEVGYSRDRDRLWVGVNPQSKPSVVAWAKNTPLRREAGACEKGEMLPRWTLISCLGNMISVTR